MDDGEVPDWLVSRIRRDPPDVPGLVVPRSTPVVCFGDQRTARVATLGINPSFREFVGPDGRLLAGDQRRLETLDSLGAERLSDLDDDQVRRVLDGCYGYFHRKPYQWFETLRPVLAEVGVSYADGSACHLDLVQWATVQVWKDKSLKEEHRRSLLADDEPFLVRQLTWERPVADRFGLVLVNGETCYLQCKAVGVPWVDEDLLVVDGKKSRFWSAEWHGVRMLCWSANVAYRPTPRVLVEAVPQHAAQLLANLGWAPAAPVAKRAEPSRESIRFEKPIVVPIAQAVAALIDDLQGRGVVFEIDVQPGFVALLPHADADPVVLLDDTGVTLALLADSAARLLASCPASDLGPDLVPGRQRVHVSAAACAQPGVRTQVMLAALRALRSAEHPVLNEPVGADELVEAIVEAVRFSSYPADMAAYWKRRWQVLTELLTAGLAPLPPADPARPWRSPERDREYLTVLLKESAEDRLEATSPLRRYLEAPEVLLEIPELNHDPGEFSRIDEQRDDALHRFMLDVLERAYPGIGKQQTTVGVLLAHGVEPLPPRDELQLLEDGDF